MGFWRKGVIIDAYAGGMTTLPYSSLSVEDLIKLWNTIEHFDSTNLR